MYIDITSVLKSPRFSNLLSSPGTFLYSRPRTKKRDRDNPVAGLYICILILDASNRLRIKMRIFLENAYLSRSELRRRYCKFQFIFDLLLPSLTNPEIEIKNAFQSPRNATVNSLLAT